MAALIKRRHEIIAAAQALDAQIDSITEQLSEPEFGAMRRSGNGVKIPVHGGHEAVQFMARSFAASLGDAPNYQSFEIHIEADGVPPMVVTIRRKDGMTPEQGRTKAEAEVQRLLEVCEAHGHKETTTLVFQQPGSPQGRSYRPGDPVWIYHYAEALGEPAHLKCERCGTTQNVPDPHTAAAYKALGDAFSERHSRCIDIAMEPAP